MELNEYQKQAMSTCTNSCRNFSYMMLNLVGEVGEFASKAAKAIRKDEVDINHNHIVFDCDDAEYIDQLNHLKLEAGDILWQLSGLCSTFGWSLQDIAQMNLDKLASRQQRGKIIGDGDDR